MFRLLKVLSLPLALASLGLFAMSCGSSSSQVRVVDAIPDSPVNFDIQLNGKTVFTNVGFESIEPSTGYQKVSSGSDSVEFLQTGTTTPVINSTSINLGGSSQYTVLATGFFNGSGQNAPTAVLLTDNNSAPASGDVTFRIVDASPSAPSSVDIYIVPPGTDITNVTPSVSALAFQQGSGYVSLAAAIYEVIVTPAGNKTELFPGLDYTLSAGQIRTLVLIDNAGGGNPPTLLELSDLN